MAFVICSLLNAALAINGIAFEDHPEGKISADHVPDEELARFASIPGYKVVESNGRASKEPAAPPDTPVQAAEVAAVPDAAPDAPAAEGNADPDPEPEPEPAPAKKRTR